MNEELGHAHITRNGTERHHHGKSCTNERWQFWWSSCSMHLKVADELTFFSFSWCLSWEWEEESLKLWSNDLLKSSLPFLYKNTESKEVKDVSTYRKNLEPSYKLNLGPQALKHVMYNKVQGKCHSNYIESGTMKRAVDKQGALRGSIEEKRCHVV